MAKETKNSESKLSISHFVGGILTVFAIFIVSQWYGLTGRTIGTHSSEFFSIFTSPNSQPSNYSKINSSGNNIDEKCVFKLGEKSIYDYTDYISQIYEMKGDIRVNRNSSEVLFVANNYEEAFSTLKNKTWVVKAYSHKFKSVMTSVKDVFVKVLENSENAPACSDNHSSIPAVVFSNGGYCGNFYHDINDVLVPLILTTYGFNGQVQFLVRQKQGYWFGKYNKLISKLSNYEIIDLDNEKKVHCYNHVIVGLRSHDDFKTNLNIDFRNIVRKAYSLERDFSIQMEPNIVKKPRVLIIGRKKARAITNINEIVSMLSELGFEVLVHNLISHEDASITAKIVNSCDIMIGVHGAGLTNMIYLPNNAIMMQILPLGDSDDLLRNTYMLPALNLKLRYLQYKISEEESSLIYRYPRNDPVFTDVKSIYDKGWWEINRIFLREQNITINTTRFRPVLEEAMKIFQA